MNNHKVTPAVGAQRRRKCRCGCEQRATHVGWGNGNACIIGCQLAVYRWRRDAERRALAYAERHGRG